MKYYAVLNLFNSDAPELVTKILTEPPHHSSLYMLSEVGAIEAALGALENVIRNLTCSITYAANCNIEDDHRAILRDAHQLTVTTLKMTALVHLAMTTSVNN